MMDRDQLDLFPDSSLHAILHEELIPAMRAFVGGVSDWSLVEIDFEIRQDNTGFRLRRYATDDERGQGKPAIIDCTIFTAPHQGWMDRAKLPPRSVCVRASHLKRAFLHDEGTHFVSIEYGVLKLGEFDPEHGRYREETTDFWTLPLDEAIVEAERQAEHELALDSPEPVLPDEESFPEGRAVHQNHVRRERNRVLIDRAKRLWKSRMDGSLRCLACSLKMDDRYGEVGIDYVEFHHILPLSESEEGRRTAPGELVPLCPNCHRMVHRRRPWLDLDGIRSRLVVVPESGG